MTNDNKINSHCYLSNVIACRSFYKMRRSFHGLPSWCWCFCFTFVNDLKSWPGCFYIQCNSEALTLFWKGFVCRCRPWVQVAIFVSALNDFWTSWHFYETVDQSLIFATTNTTIIGYSSSSHISSWNVHSV